jgi:hypothetical protein
MSSPPQVETLSRVDQRSGIAGALFHVEQTVGTAPQRASPAQGRARGTCGMKIKFHPKGNSSKKLQHHNKLLKIKTL